MKVSMCEMTVVHISLRYLLLLIFSAKSHAYLEAIDQNNISHMVYDNELKISGVLEGVLVEANPYDACGNISAPPRSSTNASLNWFVLIKGGVCYIHEKVANAYAANYSAAIIYYVEPHDQVSSQRDHSQSPIFPNITVVLIGALDGYLLLKSYLYTSDPRSRIYIFPNQGFDIVSFLFLCAIIAGTLIFLMLSALLIKCIQESQRRRRDRLPSRHLKHLTTTKYKRGDPYETCAICLQDYKEKDKLRILPCAHAYHCRCIDPWLTNNKRTCPVCIQKVVLPGVHTDEDSSDTDGRAETRPLIRGTTQRQLYHSTARGQFDNPGDRRWTTSHTVQVASGETTSRDAPSDAVDNSPEETVCFKLSSSAPEVLPDQSLKEVFVTASTSPGPNGESAGPVASLKNAGDGTNVHRSYPGNANDGSSMSKSRGTAKPYVV